MTFGWALERLAQGRHVRRASWPFAGSHLYRQGDEIYLHPFNARWNLELPPYHECLFADDWVECPAAEQAN